MNYLEIELPIFFIALFANITLALIIIRYAPKNLSSRLFILFLISQILWISANYISFLITDKNLFLLFARLTTAFAVLHVSSLFLFIYTFLERGQVLTVKKLLILLPVTFFIFFLNLTSLVWSGVEISNNGQLTPTQGPAVPIFGIFIVINILLASFYLVRKYQKSEGVEKIQWRYLAIGLSLTFLLIFIFSFLNFVFLKNINTVRFGHLFTLPFIIFTTYALIKHNLLNVKVISTELLTGITWAVLAIQLINAKTITDRVIDLVVFSIFTFLSYLLIRGILREEKHVQQQYEMVATVSHQLRTPLTPVIGLSAMIADGDFDSDPVELKDMERKVQMSAQRLRNVINDFLESFELEGGKKFENETSNVVELIDEAVAGVKDSYEKKGLTLSFENPDKLDPQVKGERKLLIQVFSNLLDNSEKYTPNGGTKVNLKQEGSHVIVTISDTGIGLTDEDKDNLFKKFYRSQTAKEIRPDGSGLGLSIVKKILEVHGAKIAVASPGPNLGTTFTITLPKR